jgi:8-oxo-dGTP pyrophosphatase MutT (NUDIX family)
MIKHCVGAVIYNSDGKIFLMTSPKWQGFIVPGGSIWNEETEEQALKREIKSELGIDITDVRKVGEKIKPPSKDYKDDKITIHFIDFFAKAVSTDIVPDKQVLNFGWYSIDDALSLPLLDTTRQFVEQFKKYVNSGLIRFD